MFTHIKTVTLCSLISVAALTLPVRANDEPRRDPAPVRAEGVEEKKVPAVDQEALIAVIKSELQKLEAGLLKDLTGNIKGVATDVQGIKKSITSLQSDLTIIQMQHLELKSQLDSQKAMIDQLMEERKKQVANSSQLPVIEKSGLEEIRTKLNAIENAIARIGTTEKRLSMYGPTANSARVMLVNLYSDDLLFIVNGTHYRVPAGRSRSLENIPIGTVNMEVFSGRHGMLDRQATNLLAGETYTLTAFKR